MIQENNLSPKDAAKWAAARGALAQLELRPGMVLGLGTGSTADKFVRLLAERVQAEGVDILCVPTSEVTGRLAQELGLKLSSDYPDFGHLDVVVDGADEVDPAGHLIKGGGGALLREKYVALAGDRMIVIADDEKHVPLLGTTFRLPVEIVSFAWSNTVKRLSRFTAAIELRRRDGKLFVTDQGNYIADCDFRAVGGISDPVALHRELKELTGVVETGIFPGIAYGVVTGHADGTFDFRCFK